MSKTSSEVKQRWKDKTYKRMNLYLRKDEDKEYLDFISERREQGETLAEIVKEGLDYLMKENNYRTF